jgi:putative transposase
LRGERLIRVFERLRIERCLPDVLRVGNGPEFLGGDFVAWAEQSDLFIRYIQPGKPNQNAFIERFNKTYRDEVLDLYLFDSLDEAREMTYHFMVDYKECRPYDSLNNLTPLEHYEQNARNSTFELFS